MGPLEMYYQIYGDGRPLLVLHGGFGTIEGSFPGRLIIRSTSVRIGFWRW